MQCNYKVYYQKTLIASCGRPRDAALLVLAEHGRSIKFGGRIMFNDRDKATVDKPDSIVRLISRRIFENRKDDYVRAFGLAEYEKQLQVLK